MGKSIAREPGKIASLAAFIKEEEAALRAHLLRGGLRLEDIGFKFSWYDLECIIAYGLIEKDSPLGMSKNNRTFDDRDEVSYLTLDMLQLLIWQNTGKKGRGKKPKGTPRPKWVEELREASRRDSVRVMPKMAEMTVEDFFERMKQANENLDLAPSGEIRGANKPLDEQQGAE